MFLVLLHSCVKNFLWNINRNVFAKIFLNTRVKNGLVFLFFHTEAAKLVNYELSTLTMRQLKYLIISLNFGSVI